MEIKCECVEAVGATLLSADEAENISRDILAIDDWWWLRSVGFNSNNVTCVYYDGLVSYHGRSASYAILYVRPAFILKSHNLQIGDTVEIYGIKATIISDKYALVDEPIGRRRFDSESNDYEKSEIKAFVDNWYEKLRRKMAFELKPCRICGGEAEFCVVRRDETGERAGFLFAIRCSECLMAKTETGSIGFKLNRYGFADFVIDEREKLADKWNMRATD